MILNDGSWILLVECKTAQLRLNDCGLCSRHKKLFQKDADKFKPPDDLFRSMPF